MATCDVCGQEVKSFKHCCDGDGKLHYHGMVHTILRGDTNDLANVGVECGCAEKDRVAWQRPRAANPVVPTIVEVEIHGGLTSKIRKSGPNAANTVVRVYDYDIENYDEDALTKDAEGTQCFLWEE